VQRHILQQQWLNVSMGSGAGSLANEDLKLVSMSGRQLDAEMNPIAR
jgi:hypothetical protein